MDKNDPYAQFADAPDHDPYAQFADAGAHPLTVTPAQTGLGLLGTLKDVGAATAQGASNGVISMLGLPADAAHYAGVGMQALMNKARGVAGYAPLDTMKDDPLDPQQYAGSAAIGSVLDPEAGRYKPKTKAGEYAQTIGEMVPGALGGGVNTARGLASAAVAPGVLSQAAGDAASTIDPAYEGPARMLGALAAPAAVGAARRVVTPLPADPARLAHVQNLRDEGVTALTAGQVTGSKKLLAVEGALSEVPFGSSRVGDMLADQGDQLTSATMRRMGSNSSNVAEDFHPAQRAIGATIEDLARRNTAVGDQQFGTDIMQMANRYDRLVPDAQNTQVGRYASALVDHFMQNGTMSGEMYQATRSDIDALRRAAKTRDPIEAEAWGSMRQALDNTMERSMSPEDAASWQQARRQWANSKVIGAAGAGAGETAAMGTITPAKLRAAATTGRREGYTGGTGPFDRLSRSANAIMTTFPNSGTTARANVLTGARAVGGAIGGVLGLGAGPVAAGGGAAAGALAGPLGLAGVSQAVLSRPGQAYLRNQLLGQRAPLTARERVGRALGALAVGSR